MSLKEATSIICSVIGVTCLALYLVTNDQMLANLAIFNMLAAKL